MGVGLITSCLTVRYRDLMFIVPFFAQLWMYITPVVYPLSLAPPEYRWVLILNPMTAIMETFKYAMFSRGTLDLGALSYSIVVAGLLLYVGALMFNKAEKTFIDIA